MRRSPISAAGLRLLVAFSAVVGLVGCAVPVSGPALEVDEALVKGPVIQDIVTPFDRALSCLDGRINRDVLRFSVGAVIDATGKEQLSESGTGKFVTQGAGDIVQSALFQAGVSLVNRRDPRVIESEAKWGIRDTKTQLGSTFFITGSVNSLDFLPGSGYDVQVAGLGPRGRQHRILVGLDLSMTETRTGRVVANIPLQKQIVAAEEGFGIGRFFGTTLVNLDMGNRHREALHFAMRQMLHLATFELLTQMMKPEQYIDCWEMVESVHGVLGNTRASNKIAQYRAAQLAGKASGMTKGKSPVGVERPVAGAAAATDTPKIGGIESLEAKGAQETREHQTAGASEAREGSPSDALATVGAGLSTAPAVSAVVNGAATAPDAAYFQEEGGRPDAVTVGVATDLPLRSRPGSSAETADSATPLTSATPAPQQGADSVCKALAGDDFPRVTPLLAGSPGQSITLTSARSVSVCVSNGDGVVWSETLQPGVPRRFDGAAPWRVQSDGLRQVQVHLQGKPLRWPAYVKDRAELQERSDAR